MKLETDSGLTSLRVTDFAVELSHVYLLLNLNYLHALLSNILALL